MKIISKENAEHYNWSITCDGWHLLKSDDLSIIQESVPPGGSEIKHFHKYSHQFFYVLKGRATIEIDNTIFTINEYESIEVKPGQPHQLRNETEETIEFLVVSSPKSHGDRVEL